MEFKGASTREKGRSQDAAGQPDTGLESGLERRMTGAPRGEAKMYL